MGVYLSLLNFDYGAVLFLSEVRFYLYVSYATTLPRPPSITCSLLCLLFFFLMLSNFSYF